MSAKQIIHDAVAEIVADETAAARVAERVFERLGEGGYLRARPGQRHGLSRHPVYNNWSGMMSRCYGQRDKAFANYGGRGIAVVDEWHDFPTFVRWAEAHGFEPGLTLERLDPNANYEPSNCTWIPMEDQPKNRRTNRKISFNGEEMTLAEAARRAGLIRQTVDLRLASGWSVEDALTIRPNHNNRALGLHS